MKKIAELNDVRLEEKEKQLAATTEKSENKVRKLSELTKENTSPVEENNILKSNLALKEEPLHEGTGELKGKLEFEKLINLDLSELAFDTLEKLVSAKTSY